MIPTPSSSSEATDQLLELLLYSIRASAVIGEPLEAEGIVRLPVSRALIGGVFLLRPGDSAIDEAPPAISGWRIRRSRRLLGHVVVAPEGIHWEPRVNVIKLAIASAALVFSFSYIVRKRVSKLDQKGRLLR